MASLNKSLFALALVGVLLTGTTYGGEASVRTPTGTIVGLEREVSIDGTQFKVHEYLGIPYAEPPVGALRLEKPKPMPPFSDPYRAVEYGPACIQMEYEDFPAPEKTSEDCLSLNIVVPAGATSSRPPSGYPVMIWIYGGGFGIGETSTYNASTLSAFGQVIVVTMNYRLAILGFLNTGDEHIPGNYGLWDQHLAIEWVHQNIESFGGDPERTTIFGESAGGMSVTYQSLFAGNKGLFQGAIAESGTLAMPGFFSEDGKRSASVIAEMLECDNAENIDSKDLKECVKSLSSYDIETRQKEFFKNITNVFRVQLTPAFDNDFVRYRPSELVQLHSTSVSAEEEFFSSINFINGMNSHEGAGWVSPLLGIEDPESFVVPRDMMETTVTATLDQRYPAGYPPELVQFVLAEYTNWEDPDDPVLLRDQYVKMQGDIFVFPGLEMTKKHCNLSGSGQTFLYQFCLKSTYGLVVKPSWVQGANHGDELAYVFGLDPTFMEKFNITRKESDDLEWNIAKGVMTLWTNFAKTWNPNSPEDPRKYLDVNWPSYDAESQRYLSIDRNSAVKQRLDAKGDNFWLKLVPMLLEMKQSVGPGDKYSEPLQDSCSAEGNCPP